MNFKSFWGAKGPTIAFYAGIGGVIGTCVLTGLAARKYKKAVRKNDDEIETIREYRKEFSDENGKLDPEEEKNYKKALTQAYFKKGLTTLKVYAPVIALGSISIFALSWSHNKNVKTISTLTTAYTGLRTFLDKYRDRVKEEVGEEKESNLFNGTTVEKVKNPETGKIEKVTTLHDNDYEFSLLFGPGSKYWDDDPDLRWLFLSGLETELTVELRAGGYGNFISENYVREKLGYPKTEMGQLVGWFYYPDIPFYENKISFGLDYDPTGKIKQFKDGDEESIWLNFNCDGFLSECYKKAAKEIKEKEKNNE